MVQESLKGLLITLLTINQIKNMYHMVVFIFTVIREAVLIVVALNCTVYNVSAYYKLPKKLFTKG